MLLLSSPSSFFFTFKKHKVAVAQSFYFYSLQSVVKFYKTKLLEKYSKYIADFKVGLNEVKDYH